MKSITAVLSKRLPEEVRGYVLQPLCNLVLEGIYSFILSYIFIFVFGWKFSDSSLSADNQRKFADYGGLRPVVGLLSANDDTAKDLAVTLVSFVTMFHGITPFCYSLAYSYEDNIRDSLIDLGVLRPLANVINGDGTAKMQEYAVNALVNLSLSCNIVIST